MNMTRVSGLMIAAGFAATLSTVGLGTVALAAPVPLAGDGGRPGEGVPPNPEPPQAPGPSPRSTVPALPIAVAVKAAQAIAAGCTEYPMGIAVVNSQGQPILTYMPDGTFARHTFNAVRKAYSAITFGENTSKVLSRAYTDPAVQAKLKADQNLIAYSGGILVESHGKVIGAIGVSGAEPGHHDEQCGMAAIKGDL